MSVTSNPSPPSKPARETVPLPGVSVGEGRHGAITLAKEGAQTPQSNKVSRRPPTTVFVMDLVVPEGPG